MTNLILCGLPSVGKTTVGRLLAKKLSYTFIDTDEELMQRYEAIHGIRLTCRDIVQKSGLKAFRNLEKEVILSLKYHRHCLIATGGGTAENLSNIYVLQYIGNLIYLRSEPETLLNRLLQSGIPPYLDQNNPKESFKKLAEKRCSSLEQAYSFVIDTEGLTPEEIAEKAFDHYKNEEILIL